MGFAAGGSEVNDRREFCTPPRGAAAKCIENVWNTLLFFCLETKEPKVQGTLLRFDPLKLSCVVADLKSYFEDRRPLHSTKRVSQTSIRCRLQALTNMFVALRTPTANHRTKKRGRNNSGLPFIFKFATHPDVSPAQPRGRHREGPSPR